MCLLKRGAFPTLAALAVLLALPISDSFLCSLCVPDGTATPFCPATRLPKHSLMTWWLCRCPPSCSTAFAFGWEGKTPALSLHISQPQSIPPIPLLISYLEQSEGNTLIFCFLVQGLSLTCTKHLSRCDPDILSVLISPAPWETVFLLLAALCLSLLGKTNQKFSRILPLSPSPCPSLTSNHIFIFLDKMLSFIYQLLFSSFFSFDYFSRRCLETLTIMDVQNSQIQSHSLVFWFFLLYSNTNVPGAGKYFLCTLLFMTKISLLSTG